jgi:hypothetical protein
MKCPFCQQELESVLQLVGAGGLVEEAYLLCSKCNIRGERKLWQELIRTRKALDIAVDVLKRIADAPIRYCMFAEEALEQITALEQKD